MTPDGMGLAIFRTDNRYDPATGRSTYKSQLHDATWTTPDALFPGDWNSNITLTQDENGNALVTAINQVRGSIPFEFVGNRKVVAQFFTAATGEWTRLWELSDASYSGTMAFAALSNRIGRIAWLELFNSPTDPTEDGSRSLQ